MLESSCACQHDWNRNLSSVDEVTLLGAYVPVATAQHSSAELDNIGNPLALERGALPVFLKMAIATIVVITPTDNIIPPPIFFHGADNTETAAVSFTIPSPVVPE